MDTVTLDVALQPTVVLRSTRPIVFRQVDTDDGPQYQVDALLTTWETQDSYGDIMQEYAFDDWLKERKAGDTTPMLMAHRSDKIIGNWDAFKKTSEGLAATGTLYADDIAAAKEAYFLIEREDLRGVSVGMDVVKYAWVDVDDRKSWALSFEAVKLLEASLTLFPANPDARVTDVKSRKLGGLELVKPAPPRSEQIIKSLTTAQMERLGELLQ